MYDCTKDVNDHVQRVQHFMDRQISELARRRQVHDASKLQEPEKAGFDEYTPKLRELEYGSPEYKQALSEMGEFLGHHYANNSHHPEYYENGISGMSLVDLIEMFCDWQAAWHQYGGDFDEALEKQRIRFGIDDQLFSILKNSWLPRE